MNIGIIGGGAIGLLTGAKLSLSHHIIIYVRRTEQKQLIKANGVLLNNRQYTGLDVQLMDDTAQADCYIVCVKQSHVKHVLAQLKETKRKDPLIFLQNGMGHLDDMEGLDFPIYLGVTDHAAIRINDYTVKQTGAGSIHIAAYANQPGNQHIAGLLDQPDFPVALRNDAREMLIEKLIVNAVINPLTAIFDVCNGAVIHNPYICKIAFQLCLEASSVLHLDHLKQWDRVKQVAQNTYENHSSMLMDIKKGRKTENDAISGYLICHAKKELPYTALVYNGVKAIEMKKGITGNGV